MLGVMAKKRPQWTAELFSKIDGIGMDVADLKTQVGGLGTKVSGLDAKVGSLNLKVSSIDTKVGSLETEVRHLGVIVEETRDEVKFIAEHQIGMQQTLDVHTEILSTLTEDVASVKISLDHKTDIAETAVLERRVTTLEKRFK